MTTLVKPNQIWNSMPGWGIVADLIPPELIALRRLRVLRRLIVAGLALLLILCVAAYVAVFVQHSSASSALAAEQARTSSLQAQQHKYADVTRIQSKLTQLQGQISTVMTGDMDFDSLLTQLRTALPGTMTIKTATIILNVGSVKGGAAATGLDTSGHTVIGTVSIAGAAVRYVDVSRYVDLLAAMTGIVNVIPTSSQANQGAVQYNLTFNVTDQLLSHRFDSPKNGGK
jgi:Tfp pilus assembly protein PilN